MPAIHGLNKTTLLDYPGRIAAVVFLGGCNFRCPFCQNSSLVLHPSEEPVIPEEEVLTFLKKRQGILEGVCSAGGEPTLASDLEDFIKKIHSLGYPVKLDTNGTRPDIVQHLAENNLIQMVAMDIKASPENYPSLTGMLHPDLESVRETADFLLHGKLDYEFRTTVVRELHNENDFIQISQWLKSAPAISYIFPSEPSSRSCRYINPPHSAIHGTPTVTAWQILSRIESFSLNSFAFSSG